jgi:hypothetical protein
VLPATTLSPSAAVSATMVRPAADVELLPDVLVAEAGELPEQAPRIAANPSAVMIRARIRRGHATRAPPC